MPALLRMEERSTDNIANLDQAGKRVEQYIILDNGYPQLADRLRIYNTGEGTKSGLIDSDYPRFSGLLDIREFKTVHKSLIPHEVKEHLSRGQLCTVMGIFPEIGRAWLVVDSDIFIWDFEFGSDITYYDGLKEIIIGVGLVKPKPGVFKDIVQYLLVLTTISTIEVLGITCKASATDTAVYDEIHIVSDTKIFVLSTDGVALPTIAGSDNGRIFMGGQNGNLYELEYQGEYSWWGKRCKIVNRSAGIMSFLMPSLFGSNNDTIIQIAIDNTRQYLYTLSDQGSIEMYDLGYDGASMSKRVTLRQSDITHYAMRTMEEAPSFGSVVHISVIDLYESSHMGLVAITESGVRFYFSLEPIGNYRPYTMRLTHIRMPPGYTGSTAYQRFSNITTAHYSKGTLLMASGNEASNKLWCLSNDLFTFSSILSESCYSLPMDGIVCMIEKCVQTLPPPSSAPEPPLIVRQLYEPSAKFTCLTSQGIEIVKKLRPVDILGQLLAEAPDPTSESVKLFFDLYPEDEVCAVLLMLACQDVPGVPSVRIKATRAIFLYGGEPTTEHQPPGPSVHAPYMQITEHQPLGSSMHAPYMQSPSTSVINSPIGFNPDVVSTPFVPRNFQSRRVNMSMAPLPSFEMSGAPSVKFSAKHDGLYKYLARILRPLWNLQIVRNVSPSQPREYVLTPFILEQCVLSSSYLLALRTFLSENDSSLCGYLNTSRTKKDSWRTDPSDPHYVEVSSLNALKSFVNHSYQIVGVWRILLEHRFVEFFDSLTVEQKSQIANVTFRELLALNPEIYKLLVNKMLNLYLGDSGSVDSISSKLKKVCPSIYNFEDAACTKANELILRARIKADPDERQQLLTASLEILKEACPRVDLENVCSLYAEIGFLKGLYELVSTCAKRVDKENQALAYYNNKETSEDRAASAVYNQRMDCYKHLVLVLNQLYLRSTGTQDRLSSSSSRVVLRTHPNVVLAPSLGSTNSSQFDELLSMCLSSDDELLHCSIYEWLIDSNLHERLTQLTSPFLKKYLERPSTEQRFGSQVVKNILWKHYESSGKPADAASTLFSLAKEFSENCTLQDRIEYLSSALVCIRSDSGSSSAARVGALFHEVEEMYQVAKVQRMVQKTLSEKSISSADINVMVKLLDKKLYTLTELYEEFVERFNLWECKLLIVDCSTAVVCSKDVIHSTWENIILSAFQSCVSSHPNEKIVAVLDKVMTLLKSLRSDSPAVDLDFLIFQLELISCRLGAAKYHVSSAMLEYGVSYNKLITVYDAIHTVNNECWAAGGDEFHIIAVIGSLSESLMEDAKVAHSQKKSLAIRLHDMVTHCLNTLYVREQVPHITEMIDWLKNIQRRLNRLF